MGVPFVINLSTFLVGAVGLDARDRSHVRRMKGIEYAGILLGEKGLFVDLRT